MGSFIEVVFAALIGAMLAPYFSYFLTIRKTKREIMLKHLEEAYNLTKLLKNYIAQTQVNISLMIGFQQYKMDMSTFPKMIESPVNKLNTILDFHLSAPNSFIERIEILNNCIGEAFGQIAKAITNPAEKDKYFASAISSALEITRKDHKLADEVIHWIKKEKQKIESEPTPFHLVYWKNLLDKCLFEVKKLFGREVSQQNS